MSLIKCPDCGTEVSDRADKCPKCACPIASLITTAANPGTVQTIEQTSKIFKQQKVFAVILIIFSMFMIIGECTNARDTGKTYVFDDIWTIGLIVGVIWLIVIRIRVWWHHG